MAFVYDTNQHTCSGGDSGLNQLYWRHLQRWAERTDGDNDSEDDDGCDAAEVSAVSLCSPYKAGQATFTEQSSAVC